MSVSTQDQYEKDMLKMQQEIIKKTSELKTVCNDISLRVKSLEEEFNEDESD